MIQIGDHENDTDDLPASYEADGAHAIPQDGQSDFDLVQLHSRVRKNDEAYQNWSEYLQASGNAVMDAQEKSNEEFE